MRAEIKSRVVGTQSRNASKPNVSLLIQFLLLYDDVFFCVRSVDVFITSRGRAINSSSPSWWRAKNLLFQICKKKGFCYWKWKLFYAFAFLETISRARKVSSRLSFTAEKKAADRNPLQVTKTKKIKHFPKDISNNILPNNMECQDYGNSPPSKRVILMFFSGGRGDENCRERSEGGHRLNSKMEQAGRIQSCANKSRSLM